MDRLCDRFEEYRRKRDRGCTKLEQRDFEEHIANCPTCGDQYIADEAIVNLFTETAPPELSFSFNENVRVRIKAERIKRSRRPMLMQAYWLVACIISVIILLNMEVKITNSMTALMFPLLCFAVPTLLLGWILRLNLFDLILNSMNRSEKRVPTR